MCMPLEAVKRCPHCRAWIKKNTNCKCWLTA
ncbi:hypothetical protein LABOLPEG_00034 [Pseudomonas phage phi 21A]|nr:hypothetical protein LABOLPEG_00034 [Pseudomonas phage phi 21A]